MGLVRYLRAFQMYAMPLGRIGRSSAELVRGRQLQQRYWLIVLVEFFGDGLRRRPQGGCRRGSG